MKKRLLLHRNKRAGGAKAQKLISEAARLLDRSEYLLLTYVAGRVSLIGHL